MPDMIYCTLGEIISDLDKAGIKAWRESDAVDKVRAASDYITNEIGPFIPETERRWFDGNGTIDLLVGMLLAITSINVGGTAITSAQYILYPRTPKWKNGPYTRLTIDPDASQLSVWLREEDAIDITGRWGLYEQTVDTGATVQDNPLSDTATTLLVDDGSKISPGGTLLVGSEQVLVSTTSSTVTDSGANTAEALDTAEEEVDVDNAALVNIGETMRIDFERMRILDKSGNTLLVMRGYDGTKRASHNTGSDVNVYRSFTVERGVNGTTAVQHAQNAAISRYIAPYDVNYLCRQIAVLMMKKAQTGYAGKTANVEIGEVFYHEEFPKDAIMRIKKNYRITQL